MVMKNETENLAPIASGPELLGQLDLLRRNVEHMPNAAAIFKMAGELFKAAKDGKAINQKDLDLLNRNYFDLLAKKEEERFKAWPKTISRYAEAPLAALRKALDPTTSIEEQCKIITCVRLYGMLAEESMASKKGTISVLDPSILTDMGKLLSSSQLGAFASSFKLAQNRLIEAKINYMNASGDERLTTALQKAADEGTDNPETALSLLGAAQKYFEAKRDRADKKTVAILGEDLGLATLAQSRLTRVAINNSAAATAQRGDLISFVAGLRDIYLGKSKHTPNQTYPLMVDGQAVYVPRGEIILTDNTIAIDAASTGRRYYNEVSSTTGTRTLKLILDDLDSAASKGDARSVQRLSREYFERLELVAAFSQRALEVRSINQTLTAARNAAEEIREKYLTFSDAKLDGTEELKARFRQRSENLIDRVKQLLTLSNDSQYALGFRYGGETREDGAHAFRMSTNSLLVELRREIAISRGVELLTPMLSQLDNYLRVITPEGGSERDRAVGGLNSAKIMAYRALNAFDTGNFKEAAEAYNNFIQYKLNALVAYREYTGGSRLSDKAVINKEYAFYLQAHQELYALTVLGQNTTKDGQKITPDRIRQLTSSISLAEVSVFGVPSHSISHSLFDIGSRQQAIIDLINSKRFSEAIEEAKSIYDSLREKSKEIRRWSGYAYMGAMFVAAFSGYGLVAAGMGTAMVVDMVRVDLRTTGSITAKTALVVGLTAVTLGAAGLGGALRLAAYEGSALPILRTISLVGGLGFAALATHEAISTIFDKMEGKADWVDVGASVTFAIATAGLVYVGARGARPNDLNVKSVAGDFAELLNDLSNPKTRAMAEKALKEIAKVDPELAKQIDNWSKADSKPSIADIEKYLKGPEPISASELDLTTFSGIKSFINEMLSPFSSRAKARLARMRQQYGDEHPLLKELDSLLKDPEIRRAHDSNDQSAKEVADEKIADAALRLRGGVRAPPTVNTPPATIEVPDLYSSRGLTQFLKGLFSDDPIAKSQYQALKDALGADSRTIKLIDSLLKDLAVKDYAQGNSDNQMGRRKVEQATRQMPDIIDSQQLQQRMVANAGSESPTYRGQNVENGQVTSNDAAGTTMSAGGNGTTNPTTGTATSTVTGSAGTNTAGVAPRGGIVGRVRGLAGGAVTSLRSIGTSVFGAEVLPDFGSATPKAQTALDILLKDAASGKQDSISKLAEIVKAATRMAEGTNSGTYSDLVERLISSRTVRDAFRSSSDTELVRIVSETEARLAGKRFGDQVTGQRGVEGRFLLEGKNPITSDQATRVLDALARSAQQGTNPADPITRNLVRLTTAEEGLVADRVGIMDGVSELEAFSNAEARATTAREAMTKALEPKPSDTAFSKAFKDALRANIDKAISEGKSFEEAFLDAFKDPAVQKVMGDLYVHENTSDLSQSGREARAAEKAKFITDLLEKAQVKPGETAKDAFKRVSDHLNSNVGTKALWPEASTSTANAVEPYETARSATEEANSRSERLRVLELQKPEESAKRGWEYAARKAEKVGLHRTAAFCRAVANSPTAIAQTARMILRQPLRPLRYGVEFWRDGGFFGAGWGLGVIALTMALYASGGWLFVKGIDFGHRAYQNSGSDRREGMYRVVETFLPAEVARMIGGTKGGFPEELIKWAGTEQGLTYILKLQTNATAYPSTVQQLLPESLEQTMFAQKDGRLVINETLVAEPRRAKDTVELLRNLAIVNEALVRGPRGTAGRAVSYVYGTSEKVEEAAFRAVASFVKNPGESDQQAIERIKAERKELQIDTIFRKRMHDQGMLTRSADLAAERFLEIAGMSNDKKAKDFLLTNPLVFHGLYKAYQDGHVPIVFLGDAITTLMNAKDKDKDALSALAGYSEYAAAETASTEAKQLRQKAQVTANDDERTTLNQQAEQKEQEAKKLFEAARSSKIQKAEKTVADFLNTDAVALYYTTPIRFNSYLALMDDRALELTLNGPSSDSTTLREGLRTTLRQARKDKPIFDYYNSLTIQPSLQTERKGKPQELWSDNIAATSALLLRARASGLKPLEEARKEGLLIPGALAEMDPRLRQAQIPLSKLDPVLAAEIRAQRAGTNESPDAPIETVELVKFVRALSRSAQNGEMELTLPKQGESTQPGLSQWLNRYKTTMYRSDEDERRDVEHPSLVEVLYFTRRTVSKEDGLSESTDTIAKRMDFLHDQFFSYDKKYKWIGSPSKRRVGEIEGKVRAADKRDHEADKKKALDIESMRRVVPVPTRFGSDTIPKAGDSQIESAPLKSAAVQIQEMLPKIDELVLVASGRRGSTKQKLDDKEMIQNALDSWIEARATDLKKETLLKDKPLDEIKARIAQVLLTKISGKRLELSDQIITTIRAELERSGFMKK